MLQNRRSHPQKQCGFVVATILVLSFSGCFGGNSLPSTPVSQTPVSLKSHLDAIAESGQLGSGVMLLQSEFAEFEKASPDKAAAVKKDVEALIAADGNPAQTKKLAAELSKKL